MPEILVRHQRRREHLERYLPVEPLVLGPAGADSGRAGRGRRNGAIRINKADPIPCSRPPRPARMTLAADSIPQASTTVTNARADIREIKCRRPLAPSAGIGTARRSQTKPLS